MDINDRQKNELLDKILELSRLIVIGVLKDRHEIAQRLRQIAFKVDYLNKR